MLASGILYVLSLGCAGSENRGQKPEEPAGMTDQESKGARLPKRPYQTPQVVVHGKLQALTQVKGGNRTDGAGKPGTRLVGPPA